MPVGAMTAGSSTATARLGVAVASPQPNGGTAGKEKDGYKREKDRVDRLVVRGPFGVIGVIVDADDPTWRIAATAEALGEIGLPIHLVRIAQPCILHGPGKARSPAKRCPW